MQRRQFIKTSGLLGIATLATGSVACSTSQIASPYASRNFIFSGSARRLPKLRLSHDRIIKETVGLRPFRPSGPRLETETLENKTIVHNYGHGGSGWSLSWGSADIAVEKAVQSGQTTFAVMGCGVMGLTTARTLQSKGYAVTIYAKELPPDITSSKATGTWSPAHLVCDPEKITPQFRATWERACRFSFATYQNLLGLNEIVTWVDHYMLLNAPRPVSGNDKPVPPLRMAGLTPERITLKRRQHPFRAAHAFLQTDMMFNIPSYLNKLIADFQSFGGKIHVREFKRLEDVDALAENCIINCTGLGAKELFGDKELTPVAGQLSFLIPQPEITYRLSTPDGYFIPRKDGIILGGNSLVGSWNTTPDPAQTEKVVAALNDTMHRMRSA